MKKLISLLLAIIMVFSLAVTAFADGNVENPDETTAPTTGSTKEPVTGEFGTHKGTITINKYNDSNNYSLYRILDLESFNTAGQGTYSYKLNDDWKEFFTTGYGKDFVTVDGDYVTRKDNFTTTNAPEFAKKALEYAEEKGIQPLVSSNYAAANGTTEDGYPCYTFSDLDLGYYLVDSSMGALCGLTTTNLNASINAKNGEPTLSKQVQEDSNGHWDTNNTADIGQTVNYRATINVQAGAQDYIFHDKMSAGLTFGGVTEITLDNVTVPASNYTVHTATSCDENCQWHSTPACGAETCDHFCHSDCTFHIVFDPTYCQTLPSGKDLVIFYYATLNENAVIAGNGETNSAKLEFGEDHYTETSTVVTKTYAFDLVKTDGQNTLLPGARFKMYTKTGTDAEGKDILTVFKVVKVTTDDGKSYYRPAMAGEEGVEEFEVENGMIRFQGFDPDDYYFEETVNPTGYNKLTEKVKFTLGHQNKDAIFNEGVFSTKSGFHVVNLSGTILPETGAMGTTLFITFGMFAVLAAGVLLVTKKRMSMIVD